MSILVVLLDPLLFFLLLLLLLFLFRRRRRRSSCWCCCLFGGTEYLLFRSGESRAGYIQYYCGIACHPRSCCRRGTKRQSHRVRACVRACVATEVCWWSSLFDMIQIRFDVFLFLPLLLLFRCIMHCVPAVIMYKFILCFLLVRSTTVINESCYCW